MKDAFVSFIASSAKAEWNKAKHAQKQHDQAKRQQLSPVAWSGAWWNSLCELITYISFKFKHKKDK